MTFFCGCLTKPVTKLGEGVGTEQRTFVFVKGTVSTPLSVTKVAPLILAQDRASAT